MCCFICDFGVLEKCICIRFCFKPRQTATETFRMLKLALGRQAVPRTQVFMLFLKFRCCVTTFEYAKYLGHPSASKTDEDVDWVKEYGLVVANMMGFYLGWFRAF